MPCKVAGCKQMTLYKIVKGKSKWTIGDDSSIKSKGFPMKPIIPLDICYYHNKLNGGLFDGETYGRGSGTPKHSGEQGVYSTDRK